MTPSSGLVLVDKPPGLTSHDIVSRLRRVLATRKVGHAGTLDPMATGLLVCGYGQGTRLLSYLVGLDKSYQATIQLGTSTVSEDITGAVTAVTDITEDKSVDIGERLPSAVAALAGAIDQVPSAVSAIRVNGERSHARVRRGESVLLAPRPVVIHRFDVGQPSRVTVDSETGVVTNIHVDASVSCSSGTYVRALARDLGDSLGVGGCLTALRRTRVGPFDVAEAAGLADDASALATVSVSEAAGRLFAQVRLDDQRVTDVRHGRQIPAPPGDDQTIAGFADTEGVVVAILRRDGQCLQPRLVFNPE